MQVVCADYNIGNYVSFKVITLGYEDFNVLLKTNNGTYFVKVFGNYRNKKECQRYIQVIQHALQVGVRHPQLLKSSHGELFTFSIGATTDFLCLLQFIDGDNLFDLHVNPSTNDLKTIVQQAALINTSQFKPDFIYDNWSISNFLEQYEKKIQYVDVAPLLQLLVESCKRLNVNDLPHCLVHEDIIRYITVVFKISSRYAYSLCFI